MAPHKDSLFKDIQNMTDHIDVYAESNDLSCAVGIEIGDTTTKCTLLRVDGEVLFHDSCVTPKGRVSILSELKRVIALAMDVAKEHKVLVAGIGVGVPALVEDGVVIGAVEHIPDLLGLDMKLELTSLFDLPVYIENDGHMLAVAENCYGAASESNDVVFLTIGNGIGGALKVNGELYGGSRNRGGELGHMIINEGGEQCECGNRGCLQAYASMDALVRYCRSLSDATSHVESGKAIAEGYLEGDAFNKAALNWHFQNLATGIANLINILGPEQVVIGCEMTDVGDFYIEELKQRVASIAQPMAMENVTICAAHFGNRAGSIGAATVVFIH